MRNSFILVLMILVFSISCSKDPNLQTAKSFVESYYVFANQQDALVKSIGPAHAEIEKEIELLKGMGGKQEAYRSRDVVFDLVNSKVLTSRTIYQFKVTIKIEDIEDRETFVNVTVDNKSNKVFSFAEAGAISADTNPDVLKQGEQKQHESTSE